MKWKDDTDPIFGGVRGYLIAIALIAVLAWVLWRNKI